MKEELLKGLSEEQIAKVKACKNQEELLKMAQEEGIELTDEQLEAVSGGCGTLTAPEAFCKKCGGEAKCYHKMRNPIGWSPGTNAYEYECRNCGAKWTIYTNLY